MSLSMEKKSFLSQQETCGIDSRSQDLSLWSLNVLHVLFVGSLRVL